MEEVVFFESDGEQLAGVLTLPSEHAPVVVIAHGLGSSKDGATYFGLQHALNTHGIGALRFDFSGHGQSEGHFREITLSKGVENVRAAVSFLRKRDRSMKIGLAGSSFGGAAAFYGAPGLDVEAVALISANLYYAKNRKERMKAAGIKKWKEQGYTTYLTYAGRRLKLDYAFFEDLVGYDPERVKQEAPLAFFHGEQDEIVPVDDSKRLAKLLKAKLKTYKKAGHNYEGVGEKDELIHDVIDFFIERFSVDPEQTHGHKL